MSDREKDSLEAARREGQFLHDQGVRVESSVSQASLGERIPVNSPQPEKANHMVRMSNPTAEHHPTDTPYTQPSEQELRKALGAQAIPSEHQKRSAPPELQQMQTQIPSPEKSKDLAAERQAAQQETARKTAEIQQQRTPPTQDR